METMTAFISDCHRSNDIAQFTQQIHLRGVNASANLVRISADLFDRISADLFGPIPADLLFLGTKISADGGEVDGYGTHPAA
jgi:hypothetical protein